MNRNDRHAQVGVFENWEEKKVKLTIKQKINYFKDQVKKIKKILMSF